MEHSPSVDNLLGTFWDESINFAGKAVDPCPIDQSASEWSFQEFLKESLAATAGLGPLRPGCKRRFLMDHVDGTEGRPGMRDGKELHRSVEREADEEHIISSADLRLPPQCGSSEFPTSMVTRSEDLRVMNDDDPSAATKDALNTLICFPAVNEGITANDQKSGTTIALNREDGFRNPQEHECYLKHKLGNACAAVAITRQYKARGTGAAEDIVKRAAPVSKNRVSGTQALQGKLSARDLSVACVGKCRPITSSSEVSEDEERDEQHGKGAASDLKRAKRMLSNRESARRSRRRKQAHLSVLEAEVVQLKVENGNLVQKLQEMNHKFQEAAIDNRILKADCEALRAKVDMATRDLMAGHGQIPDGQFVADSSLRYMMPYGMQRVAGESGPCIQQARGTNPLLHQDRKQSKASMGKMGHTPSMERITNLERLPKRTRSGVCCNTSFWNIHWDMEGPVMVEQHDN